MIRDRKMYVVPTPFALVTNVAHHFTLIMPGEAQVPSHFEFIGDLVRTEADELIVAYGFDLRTNDLVLDKVSNPGAGKQHHFRAWRLAGEPGTREVEVIDHHLVQSMLDQEDDDAD